MRKTNWKWYLMWVVFLTLFWAIGYTRQDPDFGSHIKLGEWIAKNKKVTTVDLFSYTMPSYPHIDHEWLTDVSMYKLNGWLGYFGLAGVFSLITLIALLILVPSKNWQWSIVPLILGASVWIFRAGIRPQVEDWLFLGIMILIFENKPRWKNLRWFFPLLMIIWANLHGGFALGIIIMLLLLVLKWVQQRKVDLADLGVWLLAVLGTLVNPYGPRLWHEVWMQMSDRNLRYNIYEWLPFFMRMELGYWLLAILTLAFTLRYLKTWSWPRLGLIAVTFLAGIISLRHMALFVVPAVPAVTEGFKRFWQEIKKDKLAVSRAKIIYATVLIISIIILTISIAESFNFPKNKFGRSYPIKAIQYLKANDFEGNLFSPYNWGGFLILEYPEKKLFVDGRMPSWRRSEEVSQESHWAFKDYLEIANEGKYQEFFDQYKITTVLWFNQLLKPNPVNWKIKIFGIEKVVSFGDRKETIFLESIKKDGWEKVYEDETAIIFKRPQNN